MQLDDLDLTYKGHGIDFSEKDTLPTTIDFTAYFQNGDEEIRVDGVVDLEIIEEDNSFDHDFGTHKQIEYVLENVEFSQIHFRLNEKVAVFDVAEKQSILNQISNEIYKLFDE